MNVTVKSMVKLLTTPFCATASNFEGWFAAFSRGAQTTASGGHFVARIVEFAEQLPLADNDDQTSIIFTPVTAVVSINTSSLVTIKCQMEMEVIATHHVGTRIEKTTLLYLSPAHINVIFTPPYHVAITILSQAVNVTPHIPLISSFIATVAPLLFFQNLVLLPQAAGAIEAASSNKESSSLY